jgi:hypothetical protein
MQLLQKAYTLADRGTPVAIRSAVCHDHLKGYFYVEADKESHVRGGVGFGGLLLHPPQCSSGSGMRTEGEGLQAD